MWYKRNWIYTYHTSKHLVDLYQTSIKAKEIEMNFIDGDGLDLTYYDIDFFGGPNEKTNCGKWRGRWSLTIENGVADDNSPAMTNQPWIWRWFHGK